MTLKPIRVFLQRYAHGTPLVVEVRFNHLFVSCQLFIADLPFCWSPSHGTQLFGIRMSGVPTGPAAIPTPRPLASISSIGAIVAPTSTISATHPSVVAKLEALQKKVAALPRYYFYLIK